MGVCTTKTMKCGSGGALKGVVTVLAALIAVTFASGFFSAAHALNPIMHNSSSTQSTYWNGGWGNTPNSKYGQFTCNTCHTAGLTVGGNAKMIKSSIATPNGSNWASTGTPSATVVFTSYTTYGSDRLTRTTSNRICDVCHSQTAHHRYNNTQLGVTTHQGDVDCFTCHQHSNGFMKPSCDSCHGMPPTTATLSANGVSGQTGMVNPTTNATQAFSPGAHAAHNNDGYTSCTICHNGNTMPTVKQQIQMGFYAFNGQMTTGVLNGYSSLTNGNVWGSSSAGTTISQRNAYTNPTCSNLYCHGGGGSGTTALTGGSISQTTQGGGPLWTGGSSQGACGTCHGTTAATTTTALGSHIKHAGSTGYSFSCTKCHPNITTPNHVKGNVFWRLSTGTLVPGQLIGNAAGVGYGGAPYGGSYYSHYSTNQLATKATYGSCQNIYCHSDANTNGTITYASPTWGGASLTCTGCHQTTGLTTGTHARHVSSGSVGVITIGTNNALTCDKCHAKTATTNTTLTASKVNHVNGYKDYSGAYAYKSKFQDYSGPTLAYKGTTKNCTTYCHSNGNTLSITYQTPTQWYTGSTTATCNYCHGNDGGFANTIGAPNYNNGGSASNTPNSHQKHTVNADFGATTTTICINCHVKSVDATTANKFKDYSAATYHLNGVADVKLLTQDGRGGNWTAGSGGGCSATYCHGSGTSAPAWGAAGPLACNSCHSANAGTSGTNHNWAGAGAQSAHKIHVADPNILPSKYADYSGNVSSASNYRFTCSVCHAPLGGAKHASGPATAGIRAADIFFAYTTGGGAYSTGGNYTPGGSATNNDNGFNWSSASCSTVYCHSNGNGGPGLATVFWNTTTSTHTGAALSCTKCHGNNSASGAPIATGKHRMHMNNYTTLGRVNVATGANGFGCVACHAKTVSSDNTVSNKAMHVNRFKDYSGVLAGGSAKYSVFAKSCSTIYCHSSGQAGASISYRNMTSSKTWTGSSNIQGATAAKCTLCHGYNGGGQAFTSFYGEPNYASGSAGSATANSHQKHVTGTTNNDAINKMSDSTGCVNCHRTTVDATKAYKLRDYSSAHLNGAIDISFKALANYTGHYTPGVGNKTCANTYCHNNGTPQWGTPGPLACNSCHNADSTLPGQHNTHWGVSGTYPTSYTNISGNMSPASNGYYRFTCGSCHGSNSRGASLHANGPTTGGNTGEVFYAFTSAGKNGPYLYGATTANDGRFQWSNGRCSNTYCHSNGAATIGLANYTSIRWNNPAGTLTSIATGACTGCHGGNASTFKVLSTNRHRVHMAATALQTFQCAECHAKTVTMGNDQQVTNKKNHVNKFRDFSGARAYKTPYNGVANPVANANCANNTYCHTNGKNGIVSQTPTAVYWGQTGTWGATLCNDCHGTSNATGAPDYATTGVGAAGANSHGKHVVQSTDCVKCHETTTKNGTTLVAAGTHLNGGIDVRFSTLNSFATYSGTYNPTVGTKTCSATYCHGGLSTSPGWGGSSLTCNTCHSANAAGSGSGVQHNWSTASAHRLHWEDKTTLPWKFANSTTANLGTAGTYRFNCAACHRSGTGFAQHASGPVSANRAADIFFGYTSAGRNPAYTEGALANNDNSFNWTAGGSNCTSTYCHSNGNGSNGRLAVNWNTTAKTADCTACHGGNATAFTAMSTGRHREHVKNASAKYSNANLGCVECHAKTVSADRTLLDKTKHVNKFKDYSGARAFKSLYAGGNATCSTYCHSNGKLGSSVGVFKGYTTWYNTNFSVRGPLGCNGCHGNERGGTAAATYPGFPNYTSGNSGLANANSHRRHVGDKGISCSNCHYQTTTNGTSITALGKHINGSANADVYFGVYSAAWRGSYTAAAGGYNGTGNKTCSNITCHSNGLGTYQTPQWGSTMNCASCHPMNKLGGAHSFHVYTSAAAPGAYLNMTGNHSNSGVAPGRYNFGCASCHPLTAQSNHGTGATWLDLRPSVSGIGTMRLRNNYSSSPATAYGPVGTAGSNVIGTTGQTVRCINIYCHSNGGSATGAVAFQAYTTPDWYNPAGYTSDPCAMCHGNWPNSARRGDNRVMVGSPSHYNGNWLGTGVAGGHAMGVHADKITNAAQFTGLLATGSTGNASHGIATQATTISCNLCHNLTVTTSANNGSAQCNGCHTQPATQASATIANKAMHVNGNVDVQFASMPPATTPFTSKAQLRDASFSLNSSSTEWHRSAGGYKTGAASYDTAKRDLNVANPYSGGTCSNVICHFNQNVQWKNPAPAVNCNSCHLSNQL
ncbi:MAG TPA: CxxxxCH/CxxCH domain-containing protein [Geobacteraceae bacterium]